MKTIGLCMIVKNEAHVIARCLASVAPLVDHVLIVDTGSTDGTQDTVRAFLKANGLPGEVVEEHWQNFAHNRSSALARLRRRTDIDYALMIDADEVLAFDPGFDAAAFKQGLTADLYDIRTVMGDTAYHRPQLSANRKPFFYKGVLHEYLECTEPFSRDTARGFVNRPIQDSARNRNPRKYLDDAEALEKALKSETDPFLVARYTFYMAQSWRDAGQPEKAMGAYRKRAKLGFWDQEIYISLLAVARLREQLGHPVSETIDAYLAAHEVLPARLEALHGAARLCRLNSRNNQAYLLAKHALSLEPPTGGLFVEQWVADYALLDEFSIAAFWAGHYAESVDACRRLLADPRTPAEHHARIRQNMAYGIAKLETASIGPLLPVAGQAAASLRPVMPRPQTDSAPPQRKDLSRVPRILMAILAKQKEPVLPFYLDCIEALDYPKEAIDLYVRTNNNTDRTAVLLRDWLARVGPQYGDVAFDDSDVAQNVQQFGVHDWNELRFEVLGQIRQHSLQRTLDRGCDFYFTADVDNFLRPHALKSLVALDLPIVAPLLRHVDPANPYSNYHAAIDAQGYFRPCDEYHWLLQQRLRGVNELPVVHCTYLVRADQITRLRYRDGTARHEYVIFSDSARQNGVPQYLDTRDIYGYLTLDESPVAAQLLIGAEIDARLNGERAA